MDDKLITRMKLLLGREIGEQLCRGKPFVTTQRQLGIFHWAHKLISKIDMGDGQLAKETMFSVTLQDVPISII